MKASRAVTMVLVLIASLAVTAPAGAGGGCHAPEGAAVSYARADGATARVDADECGFGPTVLYVDPGTDVTWNMKDKVPHSVTGAYLAWGSSELLAKAEKPTYRFEDEGVYPYLCVLHPGMSAAVIVGDPGPDNVQALAPPTRVEPPAAQAAPQPAPKTEAAETSGSAAGPVLGFGALAVAAAAALLAARRRRSAPGEATPA